MIEWDSCILITVLILILYQVPKGLEMGIGTMSRGEKAVIYVTNQYLSQSPLIPSIDDIEEVHFEVELIHFIQVCKSFLHYSK